MISGTGFYYKGYMKRIMKNISFVGLILVAQAISLSARCQKVFAEGTIIYDLEIRSGNEQPGKDAKYKGACNTIYLKGHNSRTELVSPLGTETTIHDSKQGNAVIMKEYSGQKLMIKLTPENWLEKNKSYTGISFETTNETKTIAGYKCKKAVARMANGKSFDVYYSPDLVVGNKEYNPTFTNLPGLAMEYEIESGNMRFKFTVTKINADPVLLSKFDFPKSGYRVMTYDENLQMKKGN